MTTGLARVASQSLGSPNAVIEYHVAKTRHVPDHNIRRHLSRLLQRETTEQRLVQAIQQLRDILVAFADATVRALLSVAREHFPNAQARVVLNDQWVPNGSEFARIVVYYWLPDDTEISEELVERHAAVRDVFLGTLPSQFRHLFSLDRRLNSPPENGNDS